MTTTSYRDQLINATTLLIETQFGAASMLQRKLGVGFATAHNLLDDLHTYGIVGPSDGCAARDILYARAQLDLALKQIPGSN